MLYKCPNCGCETKMSTKGAQLFCGECGKSWTLNYYGELEADKGETEFKFPTDWYDWEREQVKAEIESGNYYFESDVHKVKIPRELISKKKLFAKNKRGTGFFADNFNYAKQFPFRR